MDVKCLKGISFSDSIAYEIKIIKKGMHLLLLCFVIVEISKRD